MLLITAKSGFYRLSAIRLEDSEIVEMMNCSKKVVVEVSCRDKGSDKRKEPTIYIYK